jgi:hypothetical protein
MCRICDRLSLKFCKQLIINKAVGEVHSPPSPLWSIDRPERQKASLDNQAITGLALFCKGADGAGNR